jgi:DNA-directed RNA polymerase subunit alpha
MEQIGLPNNITFSDTDTQHIGQLVISPCQQGYGTTLGNALRRVLLSSLPGAAVTSVKIDGVQHEFMAIDGVQEDMVEVILNLKQVALSCHNDEPVTLTLKKKGAGPVTAADFDANADVEVVNGDLVLMNITDTSKTVDMEVVVQQGRGYVPAAEKDIDGLDLGTIVIDSLYTPIRDVGYKVENTRVGDVTDFEKLSMTIETDGTLSPKEAVQQATKILMDHLALVLDAEDAAVLDETPDQEDVEDTSEEEDESDGVADEEQSAEEKES